MAMSKKDYEALAGIIREQVRTDPRTAWAPEILGRLAESLSGYMAEDNPRFNRERFLAACRGEDSKDSAGRKVRYSNGR